MKRKTISLLFILSLRVLPALGDSLAELPAAEASLASALKDGEGKGHVLFEQAIKASPDQETALPKLMTPSPQATSIDKDHEIDSLIDQVERLKTKAIMQKSTILNTQNPRERKKIGSSTVYPFREGQIYEIHCGVDDVTDLTLGAQEVLTGPPVSGDTVRWKITAITSGTDQGSLTHLIVKPLEENIETNFIIPTNKRTYHLRAISSDWYMPAVLWSYPDDEKKELEAQSYYKQELEPLKIKPEDLNFSYSIDGDDTDWKPLRVFDDGQKTFIQMPKTMRVSEAPALFVIQEDEQPQLVNYRVKGDYYIVDRLLRTAELRVGEEKKIRIYSNRSERSFWDRIF